MKTNTANQPVDSAAHSHSSQSRSFRFLSQWARVALFTALLLAAAHDRCHAEFTVQGVTQLIPGSSEAVLRATHALMTRGFTVDPGESRMAFAHKGNIKACICFNGANTPGMSQVQVFITYPTGAQRLQAEQELHHLLIILDIPATHSAFPLVRDYF